MQRLTAVVFACVIGGVFLAAPDAPTFDSLPAGIDPTAKVNILYFFQLFESAQFQIGPPGTDDKALVKVGEVAESILDKLGFSTRDEKDIRRAPVPSSFFGVSIYVNLLNEIFFSFLKLKKNLTFRVTMSTKLLKRLMLIVLTFKESPLDKSQDLLQSQYQDSQDHRTHQLFQESTLFQDLAILTTLSDNFSHK